MPNSLADSDPLASGVGIPRRAPRSPLKGPVPAPAPAPGEPIAADPLPMLPLRAAAPPLPPSPPLLLLTVRTSCSTRASTRTMRSPICRAYPPLGSSSGNSWLTQVVPRRWQPKHSASSAASSNTHRVLRRLHSQQLRVPFRIFRRLASNSPLPSATGPERLGAEVIANSTSPIVDSAGVSRCRVMLLSLSAVDWCAAFRV